MTIYRPDLPGVEFLDVRGAAGDIPAHLHASRCFLLLLGGLRTVSCGTYVADMNPGDLAIIPAGLAHACSSAVPSDFLAVTVAEEAKPASSIPSDTVRLFHGMDAIAGVVLEALHTRNQDLALTAIRHLWSMADGSTGKREVAALSMESTGAPGPVAKARGILDESGDLSMDELSRRAGASRYHLSRLFKQETGLSPGEYGTLSRLRQARMLLATGVSPADAATACGYFDQSHLNLRFRKYMGFAPGQYARGCR